MLLLLAAVCLTFAAVAVGNVTTLPARTRRARIRSAATYGNLRVSAPDRVRFQKRVVVPLVGSLSRGVLRLNQKQSLESVSSLLMSAGMRDTSPQAFLASKAVAGVIGLVAGIGLGAASSSPAGAVVFGCILGAIGYIIPAVLVTTRSRRRQGELVAQLPDALDLLAVSVEAGLGFDGAVAKLTQHMHGALAEEFELALGQMRIGESRSDALKKLAERARAPEIASFVRAIVQADQLGTSLGRILRVQATDTRLKRQAAAEERAMKAPIKMLFPTVSFIFPAMFIVVLGPAMLSLGKLFGF